MITPDPADAPGQDAATQAPHRPRRAHLDAGGSARLLPAARQAFLEALEDGWADPARLHSESRRARSFLDAARETFAARLGARTEEVHLAPSHVLATHSAVRAVVSGRRRTGRAVVASAVERAAVLDAASYAADARTTGAPSPAVVPVDRLGRVDVDAFAAAVRQPGVALAALQHANGEVGTVQPVDAMHEAARAARVPLLVDAGASVGHVAPPRSWDLVTADAADWGGPQGIAVLAVRAGVRWRAEWPEAPDPWFPGGVSVPAALAAAVALESALSDQAAQDARRRELVAEIREVVARTVPDVEVVGDPVDRLPHVVTFSCLYADGEALLTELDREGFAVGSGSACTSATLRPSHVLAAMGVLTHGNVRIALDRTTTRDDVAAFLAALPPAVARVRGSLGAGAL
nr:aminotransferase class V-fold PLP-dependent enzyme [Sanguibacter suaedae]